MPYERIRIALAIKLGPGDTLPPQLLENPTTDQLNAMKTMTWIQIIRQMIRRFKDLSEPVNDAAPYEENTTLAKRHTCRHDINPTVPCVEQDI